MATNNVGFRRQMTADTSRRRSPAIWASCPRQEIEEGIRDGYQDGDDFQFMISEDAVDDVYQKYIDTGNTIRLIAKTTTKYGGELAIVTDATDNDGPVIQRHGANAGSSAIGPYFIGNTAGAAFPLWFEARVKVASIADNVTAWAVGLGQVGMVADNGLLTDDTGEIVDSVSFIGFRAQHTNGGTTGTNALLDFVYQDAGQTTVQTPVAAAKTLVADTYVKVGFMYIPAEDAAHQIKVYIDNVESGSFVTTTNIDATTFPENDPLAFVIGQKNGSAAAGTVTIDWWYCTQLYEPL